MTTISQSLDKIYQIESRHVLATLIRLLGDFDIAEESLHDAFLAAVEQWPEEGVPDNPRAWLVSTGRFKAIDKIRRRAKFEESLSEDTDVLDAQLGSTELSDTEILEDDYLRLIFTCCHPALQADVQIALTLREVCGLTTEEIAHAFLISAPTVAQRIVRAKSKIRDAKIPYQVPSKEELPERLDSVLRVIYLVFNEGYSASSGDHVTRHDLSNEAIRLAKLIIELLPESEIVGLLGLMLLTESRRYARVSDTGDIILLEEQDRSLWDKVLIAEGIRLVEQALRSTNIGPYAIQAAITAVHSEASKASDTDWPQIVGLYDVLLQMERSPVVELNRAVAIAMRDGAEVGLQLIETILGKGDLADYHLAHAAKADLCRRLGKNSEALQSYQRAFDLTKQIPERRFLERRMTELKNI